MGVIRAEPARVSDWAAKSVGAAWRAYDLQLTTYAALLVAVGLVMAYTNSVGDGSVPLAAGTTFSRGLMWAGIAVVVFVVTTIFDYHWLKTLAWPIYALQLGLLIVTLGIGSGVGGSARWITIGPLTFQFSELAKILMIIVLAAYLASREGKLDSLVAIIGACFLVGPPLILVLLQPDLGTSLVFGAILAGMLWMSGASLRWLVLLAAGVLAMVPIVWNYVLRDYQKERLTQFLDANPDIQGAGYQLHQAQIAVGLGRPHRQGSDERDADAGSVPAGPGHRHGLRHAGRGARIHRGCGPVHPVRPAGLAGPGHRLAVPRCVRDPVRGRCRLDDHVPARRQRGDGPRGHADHGDPASLRDPRRCVARQHRRRSRHPPEHQHPTDPCRLVTGAGRPVRPIRPG